MKQQNVNIFFRKMELNGTTKLCYLDSKWCTYLKKKKNSLRKFSTYFGPQWHQSSLKPQVMKEESSFAVIRMDKILSDHKPRSGVFLSLNFKVFWIMQDPKAWCNGHLEITVSDKIIWSFLCNVDDHNIIPYSISQYANILSLANVAQPTPGA